uniref:RIIa domain-containing protein n=1 Tax=Trichobilharzia regenti TaxID=157069 RepID=A0AA85KKL2_TRIRE|nr:unnamed protein product [Trichobilharzia regenti]
MIPPYTTEAPGNSTLKVMFGLGSAPPKHDPPASMEPYDLGRDGDLGALSNAQQGATNKLKTQTRLSNEQYLRQHPEVKYMVTAFLRDILTKQPENAREHFAGKWIKKTYIFRLFHQPRPFKKHQDSRKRVFGDVSR